MESTQKSYLQCPNPVCFYSTHQICKPTEMVIRHKVKCLRTLNEDLLRTQRRTPNKKLETWEVYELQCMTAQAKS